MCPLANDQTRKSHQSNGIPHKKVYVLKIYIYFFKEYTKTDRIIHISVAQHGGRTYSSKSTAVFFFPFNKQPNLKEPHKRRYKKNEKFYP